MTSSVLLDSIARSLFATDNNEVRPVMNGIYFDITDGKLALVATDGHKLVRNLIFNIDAETTTSFICLRSLLLSCATAFLRMIAR